MYNIMGACMAAVQLNLTFVITCDQEDYYHYNFYGHKF